MKIVLTEGKCVQGGRINLIATNARINILKYICAFVALLYPKIIPRSAGHRNSWH